LLKTNNLLLRQAGILPISGSRMPQRLLKTKQFWLSRALILVLRSAQLPQRLLRVKQLLVISNWWLATANPKPTPTSRLGGARCLAKHKSKDKGKSRPPLIRADGR
jgi:hypothetical protein